MPIQRGAVAERFGISVSPLQVPAAGDEVHGQRLDAGAIRNPRLSRRGLGKLIHRQTLVPHRVEVRRKRVRSREAINRLNLGSEAVEFGDRRLVGPYLDPMQELGVPCDLLGIHDNTNRRIGRRQMLVAGHDGSMLGTVEVELEYDPVRVIELLTRPALEEGARPGVVRAVAHGYGVTQPLENGAVELTFTARYIDENCTLLVDLHLRSPVEFLLPMV